MSGETQYHHMHIIEQRETESKQEWCPYCLQTIYAHTIRVKKYMIVGYGATMHRKI